MLQLETDEAVRIWRVMLEGKGFQAVWHVTAGRMGRSQRPQDFLRAMADAMDRGQIEDRRRSAEAIKHQNDQHQS